MKKTLIIALLVAWSAAYASPPNILFVLSDDQSVPHMA